MICQKLSHIESFRNDRFAQKNSNREKEEDREVDRRVRRLRKRQRVPIAFRFTAKSLRCTSDECEGPHNIVGFTFAGTSRVARWRGNFIGSSRRYEVGAALARGSSLQRVKGEEVIHGGVWRIVGTYHIWHTRTLVRMERFAFSVPLALSSCATSNLQV